VSSLLGLLVALAALIAARLRKRRRLPARAVIVSPRTSTVLAHEGTVRSVQSVELTVSAADLDRLWNPMNLENLASTYWRFLSRVTLHLIRVTYTDEDRRVVLLVRPLTLLRFDAPEYVLQPDHGKVVWRIRDGLLVAREGRGRGFLALDVRRLDADGSPNGRPKVRIEVEVANFYPAIAAGLSMPVYEATQSSIHVLVTYAFLGSLTTLDLAESKVGKLVPSEAVTEQAAPAAQP
jgi:hypothetical protein